MRYTVDVPAADWPTLPDPGGTVAMLIGASTVRPVWVVSAEQRDDRLRLELDDRTAQILPWGAGVPDDPGDQDRGHLTVTGMSTSAGPAPAA